MIDRGLEKETLGTCMAVLERVQSYNGLCSDEQEAIQRLQQYLRRLDTSMDVNGFSGLEQTLDEPARSYLASFREKYTHRQQHMLLRPQLERLDLVGESPPLRMQSFESEARGNRELLQAMSELESIIHFNVFEVGKLAGGCPLETVGMALIQRYNLCEKLSLPESKLRAFMRAVESAYKQNPYHNNLHAADVVQSLAWLLSCDTITRQLTDLELLCMIIAATVHDVGHPGVRNDFLVNLGTEAAVRYNDNSVNENGHAALTFELLYQQTHNFIAHMSLDERRFFRRMIVSIVLATDMSVHDEQLQELKDRVQECGTHLSQWHPEAREALLRYLVHTADITNPIRPAPLRQEWSRRIMLEFYAQGDRERDMGMPVSALCDRDTTDWPKSQGVFLDCVVRPVYEALTPLLPKAGAQALHSIEDAKSHWRTNSMELATEYSTLSLSSSPVASKSVSSVFKVPSSSMFPLEDLQ